MKMARPRSFGPHMFTARKTSPHSTSSSSASFLAMNPSTALSGRRRGFPCLVHLHQHCAPTFRRCACDDAHGHWGLLHPFHSNQIFHRVLKQLEEPQVDSPKPLDWEQTNLCPGLASQLHDGLQIHHVVLSQPPSKLHRGRCPTQAE